MDYKHSLKVITFLCHRRRVIC